jgi:hypothetical protein
VTRRSTASCSDEQKLVDDILSVPSGEAKAVVARALQGGEKVTQGGAQGEDMITLMKDGRSLTPFQPEQNRRFIWGSLLTGGRSRGG